MDRYACVNKATSIVDNVAEWDGVTPWHPGEQYEVIECDPTVTIGDRYEARGFTAGVHPDIVASLGVSAETIEATCYTALDVNARFSASDPTFADALAQVQVLSVQVSKLVRFVLIALGKDVPVPTDV